MYRNEIFHGINLAQLIPHFGLLYALNSNAWLYLKNILSVWAMLLLFTINCNVFRSIKIIYIMKIFEFYSYPTFILCCYMELLNITIIFWHWWFLEYYCSIYSRQFSLKTATEMNEQCETFQNKSIIFRVHHFLFCWVLCWKIKATNFSPQNSRAKNNNHNRHHLFVTMDYRQRILNRAENSIMWYHTDLQIIIIIRYKNNWILINA